MERRHTSHFPYKDANGLDTSITIVAGTYKGISAVPPTPHSWAMDSDNDVAIWVITMQKGASFAIPASLIGLECGQAESSR